jgi:hypothetical protein
VMTPECIALATRTLVHFAALEGIVGMSRTIA